MTARNHIKSIFLAILFTLISSCGGGGGGGGTPVGSLGGVAAVGTPIADGTVNVVCARGAPLSTSTGNTGSSSGAWQVTLSGQTLPCAVELSVGTINGQPNTTLYHSIATVAGTVNVTPLTDLIVANLAGSGDTGAWFAGVSAVPATLSGITSSGVATALNNVANDLSGGLSTLISQFNPVTTSFAPAPGNVSDDMLTALSLAMRNAGVSYAQLLAAAASSASVSGFDSAVPGFNSSLAVAYDENTKSGGMGLQTITVTPATPSVAAGFTQQFTATGSYSDGTSVDITALINNWSSGDTSIATVNSSGLATSKIAGSATITATLGTVSGSATLAVTSALLESITVTSAASSVAAGLTQQFTATGSYSDGTHKDITSNNNVSWVSSDSTIATVDPSSGLATGVKASNTPVTITASYTVSATTISGSMTLTVTPVVLESIMVTPANPSIAAGLTQQFTATGNLSDGTTQTLTSGVSWVSSNTSVALVDLSSGLATGVKASSTPVTITASYTVSATTISGSTTLTVTSAILKSITVTPVNPSIVAGLTQQFTATESYSDATSKDITSGVTWSSDTPSVATVSSAGLATGVAGGSAIITAASGSVSGSVTLNVVQNALPLTIDAGPTGLPSPDINIPFVSVTICVPNTSTCQTIDHILVDTGSTGLRIISSVLNTAMANLPQETDASGNALAECIVYASNNSWGAVRTADVQLAGAKASSVPVHIIGDPAFSTVPSSCANAGSGIVQNDVSSFGANGIIGLSVFLQDCGSYCVSGVSPPTATYYSCPVSGCQPTFVKLTQQVPNPVALLPTGYNNGVVIELPAISSNGAATVSGSLILGVGTQSNNALGSGTKIYDLDATYGNFTTVFNSVSYTDAAFLDSGSNGLFFASGLPTCSSGFYCPATTKNLSAINSGVSKGGPTTVNFSVANANTLFSANNSSNTAFSNLAGPTGSSLSGYFDWGLPFFFGKSVFTVFENQTVPNVTTTGPFVAY